MLYMRFAESLQPHLAYAIGKSHESCPHISGQGFDFRAHRLIQDFDLPYHD